MKRTRLVRTVCLVLALLMTATLVFPLVFQSFAETPMEKLKRLQNELKGIQTQVDENKDNIKKATQVKQAYVNQRNNILEQIETLKVEMDNTQATLDAKQKELGDKVLQVADTQKLFDNRMVAMYTTKNDDQLAVLLGATSFSAVLRYSENLDKMAKNDTELLTLLRQQQAELEQQKTDIEAVFAQQQANQAELDRLNAEYANSIRQTDKNISAEEADLQANQASYNQKFAEEQSAKDEVNAWLAATGKVDFEYGGGPFFWPCPGFTGYSSGYGPRILYGKPDFHRGVDLKAPSGTPIYAAADGVASTQAHWSYGNCVKLANGSGIVTLYAHMLERAVSDGEFVTRGQLIGYVGSTGQSTGPHLHFEVNLNGQHVNPMPYLNK